MSNAMNLEHRLYQALFDQDANCFFNLVSTSLETKGAFLAVKAAVEKVFTGQVGALHERDAACNLVLEGIMSRVTLPDTDTAKTALHILLSSLEGVYPERDWSTAIKIRAVEVTAAAIPLKPRTALSLAAALKVDFSHLPPDRLDELEACVERYMQNDPGIGVALLLRFPELLGRQDAAAILLSLVEGGKLPVAERWVSALSRVHQVGLGRGLRTFCLAGINRQALRKGECILDELRSLISQRIHNTSPNALQVRYVELCLKSDLLRNAARAVRDFELQAEFPLVEMQYQIRSIQKLAKKGLWSTAASITGDDPQLQVGLYSISAAPHAAQFSMSASCKPTPCSLTSCTIVI